MTLRERLQGALRALSGWTPDASNGPSNDWLRYVAKRFVSGRRDDYGLDLTTRRATPERLGDALREADQGDTQKQYEVFEEVERDPQVSRLYSKRRQAVLERPLTITPAGESDQAQRSADLCTELLLGMDGVGGLDDFHDALFDLTDAIGKAFSASQIVWELEGGLFRPRRFIHWPQVNFTLGDPTVAFDDERDAIRIITEEHQVDGVDLRDFPLGTWIVHRQKAFTQPLARASLFRAVCWYWLFKRFGMSDWSIFLERYGVPPRMGKYRPGMGEADRNAMWEAVLNLGKDHACIMPDTGTIELLEMKGLSSGAPHPEFLRYCNDQIAIALVGSTMAVTQGEKGARSAVEAYQLDEGAQARLDGKRLAATLRQQLLSVLVHANLGPGYPVPNVAFLWEDETDLDLRSQVDERLHRMGKAIPISYVVETYGVPEPEDGEPILPAKPAPAAPMPPGQAPPADDVDLAEEEAEPARARSEAERAVRVALRSTEKKSLEDWVVSMILSDEP